jgi:hypothetical protein
MTRRGSVPRRGSPLWAIEHAREKRRESRGGRDSLRGGRAFGSWKSRGPSAAGRRLTSGDRHSLRRRQPSRCRTKQRPKHGQPSPPCTRVADAGPARVLGAELTGCVEVGEGGVHEGVSGVGGCWSPGDTHHPWNRPPCCERSVTQPGIRAARARFGAPPGCRAPSGLGPAPREQLAADRAVGEGRVVDVHVETARVAADLAH